MADSGPNWLGLLKWSLQYSDGTAPTSAKPMSAEDQEFLTRVMEEGIRNDSTRMREIMFDIATYLEESVEESKSGVEPEHSIIANTGTATTTTGVAASRARAAARAAAAAATFRQLDREEQDSQMEIELDELQDIVEQIDMAQDFIIHMKGAECILDLVEDKKGLVGNMDVRCKACVVLGTLTQNNAKVQEDLFKHGIIGRLASNAVSLLTLAAPNAAAASLLPSPEIPVNVLLPGVSAGAAAAAAESPWTAAVSTAVSTAVRTGLHGVSLGFQVGGIGVNGGSSGGGRLIASYTLLTKILYALSCAIRSHALAEEVFIRGQFGSTILRAVLTPALAAPSDVDVSSSSNGTDDATRVLHNILSTCRCKALFLSNALLTSGTLSLDAKKQLLEALFPHCLAAFADIGLIKAANESYSALGYDNIDLRQQTLQLLLNAIRLPNHIGEDIINRSSAGAGFDAHQVIVARVRTLTASIVALRRRLQEQPPLSAAEREDSVEALERHDGELASLGAVRKALTYVA